MSATVEYLPGRPATYVVRCPEHGDQTATVTRYGLHRLTIFQGHDQAGAARRFVTEHNAVQHSAYEEDR